MLENNQSNENNGESVIFPGSNDISMSASVPSIGVIKILRPESGDMYSLYFEDYALNKKEEIAFISGSTHQAEKEFGQITNFLRSKTWESWEEAKDSVREYISKLHNSPK